MILAIDQGTTGTTCLVVDERLRVLGRGYREIAQHFPQPGWVEHDPEEIWASVARRPREALARGGASAPSDLAAIGITNQRETTVVWERAYRAARCTARSSGRTGGPPSAARSCRAELIRERTGLVPDPYFSATKLEWILATHRAAAAASSRSGRSTRGSSGS